MTQAAYFPLPVTEEQISADWLTAALRQRAPEVTVRGFEFVDAIRGTSSKIRLRLDLDEAGKQAGIPELVILKGGFEPHSRDFGYMHEREVRGYRDVLTRIPLPAPACYFADFDAQGKQGIIIMEDLVASGATFCHATRPQAFEQVARRLEVLAKFHASTWDSPSVKAGGEWEDLVDFLDTVDNFFALKTAPATWQRFIASPRGVACSVRFQDRDWMLDAWQKMKVFAKQLPYSVLHGDIHLGNLFIAADGTPGFFDTLASRGPGMIEVSYHISASVDSADRPRWEGALVQHYLDALRDNGVDAPGFDEAMHQYGVFLVYGHFIWMTTESEYQTESVNTANIARVNNAMLEHDIDRLLANI
ncbi:phosphotransferase [Haliea sp. E17]|uniref:phosphotransferase n=1 Tax=Haliea sp. E17 TaxID=3401576 RepID=UPI003AABAC01